MTIQRSVFPNEILFRFTGDGSAIQGCHRRDIEIVKDIDTDIIYSAKELDPQPIEGADMDAVLGTINTALTVSFSNLTNELAAKQAELDQANGQISQLQSLLAAAQQY